ncbi:magnesium-dependent phosphatase-1 [Violaceomyces palustris]|uniref:Magnesium-dependent phosphatase-1 n=1 Tax=Violaceomyces palustris TaxID=1673888 RepID=A0ACD0NPL9_9BASI|nr:magnesium-dependent phosphatase-1 [Violaceomyces palustris]
MVRTKKPSNSPSKGLGSEEIEHHLSKSRSIWRSLDSLNEGGEHLMPKLAVFDLDYTLWPAWVDTHVDPPLKRKGEAINTVVDSNLQSLRFYPHVPAILFYLKRNKIEIAAASRTCAPNVARQALNGLVLVDENHYRSSEGDDGKGEEERIKLVKSISLFDYQEIYPGSKIAHFKQIQKDSGVEYEDMIFFDDESRNAEVSTKLGVHFVQIGASGTDLSTFEKGIKSWRSKKLSKIQSRRDLE